MSRGSVSALLGDLVVELGREPEVDWDTVKMLYDMMGPVIQEARLPPQEPRTPPRAKRRLFQDDD